MGINVKYNEDFLSFNEAFFEKMPTIQKKAFKNAAYKTSKAMRTEAVKFLREDYFYKAGTVRSAIEVIYPHGSKMSSGIKGAGSRGIKLINFVPSRKPYSTKRLKRGGYSPKGGAAVKFSKRRGKIKINGAFISTMPSGHRGIYVREKGKIRELFAPSPEALLSGDKYDAKIFEVSSEKFPPFYKAQIERFTKR